MRVLAITNLFPDTTRPHFAPFNKQQLYHLSASCDLTVVSPVPWPHRLRAGLRGTAPAPLPEFRGRADIKYPVFWYTPKILRDLYGTFYYSSIKTIVRRLCAVRFPDVIYATWAYPDCWAAVRAGRDLGVPVVSRLHGSDINDYMKYPGRKRLILEALRASTRIVSVSDDLKQVIVREGIEGENIDVLRNGIDGDIFHPMDSKGRRERLGLPAQAKVVLFVGNLNHGKGIQHLLRAAEILGTKAIRRDFRLDILGDGPFQDQLKDLADLTGLTNRVFFHGRVPHRDIGAWMAASDLFCLPSLDEGTPNVILEALACGTPVLATDTGGIPEVVGADTGILFKKADEDALADALDLALSREWDRQKITSPAGSWEENAQGLLRILERAAA